MNFKEDPTIEKRSKLVFKGMKSYMDDDVAYQQKHIDQCRKIVDEYFSELVATKDATEGKQVVIATVLKLNKLNEECDHELIETDQREDLCAIIIRASEMMGYSHNGQDITEEWREW